MGAAELVGKIVADAEVKAARIVEEGRRAVVEIEARAQTEAGRIREEALARAKRETELILERTRSRSRMELRQMKLGARWRAIERVFNLARGRVVTDSRYPGRLDELTGKYRRAGADVERLQDGEPGGLIVRSGRETVDLSVRQVLLQLRDELVPELARRLFSDNS